MNWHPLNQSPLYKLRSRRRLAELICVDLNTLRTLSGSGRENYQFFHRDAGTGKSKRYIESPKKPLKVVQRRLHDLLSRVEPPDFLFSGIKGRSIVRNAERHDVTNPLIKLDIQGFYPKSDGRRVFAFFREQMHCTPDVAGALCDLTTIPTVGGVSVGACHLPTGGVTSQILGYYAYRDMFAELAKLADQHDCTFSMMVDDLTFSGRQASPRLLNEARLILQRHALHSRRSKEKVFPPRSAKIVTGVVLTNKGHRIPNARRGRIHQLYKLLNTMSEPIKRCEVYQRLVGSLFSAAQIEPDFAEDARRLLAKWKRDHDAWLARRILNSPQRRMEDWKPHHQLGTTQRPVFNPQEEVSIDDFGSVVLLGQK